MVTGEPCVQVSKVVTLLSAMLPTHQFAVREELSIGIVDGDVSRKRGGPVLFEKHDDSAVVLQEELKELV